MAHSPVRVLRPGGSESSVAGVLAVVGALALLYWPTSQSMWSVWAGSNTFSHGFFIVPAFAWLAWSRRHALAALPRQPSPWALPALLLATLAWLAGQAMALALPSQIALVAMVPAAVAGLFGMAWVRALMFPLAFLGFAVPAGESLVPLLMDWTADVTVAALQLSGVPVYRDGLHFEIPSGRWSVVDSCSGIRYLFACVALSSLYGWLIYRSNARRWAFVGLSVVVAVAANWLRSYAIVMLGHLSDNRVAAGADHLIYGAVFFALLMVAMFALGAVWTEKAAPLREANAADGAATAGDADRRAGRVAVWPALASVALLVAGPLLWLTMSPAGDAPAATLRLATPSGWREAPRPADWQPLLQGPQRFESAAFARDGRVVGVYVGVFGRSSAEAKLTAAGNRLLAPDGEDPAWKLASQGRASARWGGEQASVNTAVLLGRRGRLLVWQGYWVDGRFTADPLNAALRQLVARLRGRPESTAWIALYTAEGDGDAGGADASMQALLDALAAPVNSALGTRR